MRLPPQIFWALSLPEWRAIANPLASPTLSRRAFCDLMQRYPDDPHAE